jgi:hypothetical protein
LCVTVLKQRCREHGITRWPFRKVKKLDTIISALGGPGGETAADADRRLATLKRTRESLITDPNSDAHLRVGKRKTARTRVSQGSGSESAEGDAFFGGARDGKNVSNVNRPRAARVSSGVDGLLEAAASLSSDDNETPGTPTRSDGMHDRSPRVSGMVGQSVEQTHHAHHAATDAALALGALHRPAGAFAPVKPTPQSVAFFPGQHSATESVHHALQGTATGLDPKVYAAALQAFARGMSAAAHASATPAWSGMGMQSEPAPAQTMGASQQLNQHVLFAWMAAMSAPSQPQVHLAQQQWNHEALQRLVGTMRAAASASGTNESAHQPL